MEIILGHQKNEKLLEIEKTFSKIQGGVKTVAGSELSLTSGYYH